MMSVIIPTCDDAETLAPTLVALVPAAAEGLVREVVVVDAGSKDATAKIADEAGCLILPLCGGLAERISKGAEAARRGAWLLFLRPGVILDPRWEAEAMAVIERMERARPGRAFAFLFRFGLEEMSFSARLREKGVNIVGFISGLPHPLQPLLISRTFYLQIDGYRDLPALEDIDLIRRIGRRRIIRLKSRATVLPMAEEPVTRGCRLRRSLARGLALFLGPAKWLVRLHGKD